MQGADPATTKDLLAHMTVVTKPDLAVPETATSMSVVAAYTNQKPATTTSQDVITPVLDALRELPSVPVAEACSIPAYFGPRSGGMVVTFTNSAGATTSFLTALAPCSQVTSGTGIAGSLDDALAQALASAPTPPLR